MQPVIHKKLNLLVHLAKIDGNYEKSEKKIIQALAQKAGLKLDDYESGTPISLDDFADVKDKADVMYWALRVIKADGVIHPDEVAYCKALALKLNYKAEVVDHFSKHDLAAPEDFKAIVSTFEA